MTNSIPVCYFPTQKILLDDDSAFSDSLLLHLRGNNFSSYNSPYKALNYLREYQPTLTKSSLIHKDLVDSDSSAQSISINIDKLKKLFLNPPHQDISVLLVDYHMPEMQGIDFLKQISHLPIKKALITGENDYKIAVDAFNEGIVDAYLRKNDPNFTQKIQNIVSALEWKYFVELSSLIYEISDFNFLTNEDVILTFKKFINEHDINSFCLTNIQGNFIAQSSHKKQKHFILRDKMQLQELAKIAEEDGGSIETIENLKHGKVIPFFDCHDYWEIPANEWDKYLHLANDLTMDSSLVWAAISG